MIKVMPVFGTRPEAIKLAPVIRSLRATEDVQVRICVTAQHRQMLDQVLQIFQMQPDYDLDLMSPNQSLFKLTGDVVRGLQPVLEQERPDVVLVQGDTTTVFGAALAAFYLRIPVGHVEAGLRTSQKFSPFPEEINRRLTTVLADYHFAPTPTARASLLKEGIAEQNVYTTGNTVIDALFWAVDMLRGRTQADFEELRELPLDGRVLVVTGHRRENFGDGFKHICQALRHVAERNRDVQIVYPVHLNPNVRGPVYEILSNLANVHLIPPLSYLPFVYLMSRAYFILTDSGGVQEEAPSLGKPVLVMRDTTERPEAVQAGTVKLVGSDFDRIVKEVQQLLEDSAAYDRMSQAQNPYGDGRASERIARILIGRSWEPFTLG